jgi:Matrixin
MLNFKKIFAIAFIATFLATIPIALSVSTQELVSVTYTIKAEDYYAKPGGTPGGGGKPSPGYQLTGYKWLTLPLTVRVNPDGLSSTLVGDAIYASAEAWDVQTNAELVNSYQVDTSVTLDGPTADGINEIVFGPIADSSTIAQCTFWFNRRTKGLVDFEIVFNTQYTWGDATVTPSLMDVQNIATHEIGHGFGLADLYDTQWSEQTMYGYGSAGETKKRTLESGDIAGIQKLYG